MLLYIMPCSPISTYFFCAPLHDVYAIPSPGIYAVITLPVLNLTLAIFLSPELGFLGFVVPTFRHTPFNSGLSLNCGDRSFRDFCAILPCLSTCIKVHLCARDAGAARSAKVGVVVCKAVAAIEGRIDRDGAKEADGKTDGRMRRRRIVRGIVGVVFGFKAFAISKVRGCELKAD
jgi:hypothetical protein